MSHRPRKRFGQNFLHDRHVIERIVSAIAPQPEDHIVEIGPGQGALTRQLAGRCRLSVIELDRDLAADLRGQPNLADVQVIEADALNVDLAEFGEPLRLVGNLPYNISTPILFWALAQARCVRDMHFMLQKEVVERMAAEPGSKIYGRLSVMLQYRCEVQPLFRVAPGSFHPVPKVDSAVVRLLPRIEQQHVAADEDVFSETVRRAFSQRRKTAGNSLKGWAQGADFEAAGLDPRARTEQFSVRDFVALSNAIAARQAG